ncbi:MAG: gamma-glutamylcyclotransferase [Gemmataceae bacterium]
MVHLFLYGTLKRGGLAHHLMDGQQFQGEVKSAPRFRLYDCGPYPGLVEDEAGIAIEGELWLIDESILPDLDKYEGDRLFERKEIQLEDGRTALAYLYLRDVAGLPDCGSKWQV